MSLSSTIRMIFTALIKPKQHISIQEIPTGRVIDIGGGGEGVIAQAGGARVVAIDKRSSEIYEARDKARDVPWVVADAAALPFAGHSFDNATAFFSCMYMPGDLQEKVFSETRRVLKEGGQFWIWDAHMAPKGKVFAIRLQVDSPAMHTINTIYGVKAKSQSAAGLCSLLRQAGFEPQLIADRKHWFLIEAK
jgi:ubiquinone/menaquinone biosynthesis C-methylase UbiE